MKHTLVALVENKPGVLNRVASLFRRRNFNIDSLTVGRTDNPHISRMTIVMDSEADAEQVQKQLYKLINVIQVEDVTQVPGVSRDLALIKIQVDSRTRTEVVQLCEIFRARIVDVTSKLGDRGDHRRRAEDRQPARTAAAYRHHRNGENGRGRHDTRRKRALP